MATVSLPYAETSAGLWGRDSEPIRCPSRLPHQRDDAVTCQKPLLRFPSLEAPGPVAWFASWHVALAVLGECLSPSVPWLPI